MKYLGKIQAFKKLHAIKMEFAEKIRGEFEHRAKSCVTCETPGACCLDAHFVNVHISRLEAAAIRERLDILPDKQKREIYSRIESVIEDYGLDDMVDSFSQTYACPLFEKGTGCIVHEHGKPLPCIAHACYEKKEDLPPDELLAVQEIEIDKLNERVYGKQTRWLPIPVAIKELPS